MEQDQMSTSVKAYKGVGMEGLTAKWYAKNTAKSMNDFRSDARRVAALLAPGAKVLEVAPGPGYFAIELAWLSLAAIRPPDWISARRLSKSRRRTPRRLVCAPSFARAAPRICPLREISSTFSSAGPR